MITPLVDSGKGGIAGLPVGIPSISILVMLEDWQSYMALDSIQING